MTTESPLREVARNAVRDEVMRAAWLLFAEHGFEATTVEQIAHAAGMSRRTFFRYFTGKDELILEKLLEAGDRLAEALRARPADEPAWAALRGAFDSVVAGQEQNPEAARRLGQLLRDEPSTRGTMEVRRRRWTETLGPLVAERLPDGSPLAGAAVAGAAIACLDAAQDAWFEDLDSRFVDHLDAAMAAVSAGV